MQWNADFSNLQRERKLVREIGSSKYLEENYSETNPREGNDFWFELSGFLRNRGFEKSGFHCTDKYKRDQKSSFNISGINVFLED